MAAVPQANAVRFVQSAVRRPHRCAVVPFIGQNHPEGFFDTATEFHGERVYVSVVAVKEMARMLGWAPPIDIKAAREYVLQLSKKLEGVESELAEAYRLLEAHGLVAAAKEAAVS